MRGKLGKGGKGPFGAQGSVGHLGVIRKLFRMVHGADDALHAAIGINGKLDRGPDPQLPIWSMWSEVVPKLDYVLYVDSLFCACMLNGPKEITLL